jgi:predicted HD superfamily hydrolase involved in NAD metabolism
MTYEQAKEMVKGRLSAKRYRHTLNVKKVAVELAGRYGADPEKAALAAILHDSAKELPKAELLQIFRENAIIAENAEQRPPQVWHGLAAAILCQTKWGVTDPEILSAIRCHTTGKPGMNKLDKIIYLADMTSAERDYPGVEELRTLEREDLDLALCRALERTLAFVEQSGKPVDPVSAAALEDVRAQLAVRTGKTREVQQ